MKRTVELRRKSPMKRRAPKKPSARVTCRAGLLWRNGAPIPLPEADTVAMAHGYEHAEDMVRDLRYGTESVLEPVRKARKPLRKVSKKLAAKNFEYAAAKAAWRAQHDGRCEMMLSAVGSLVAGEEVHAHRSWLNSKVPGVKGVAVRCQCAAEKSPHHTALRGPNLCKIETFMGCCARHHRFIHDHPNEARRLGYLIKL